MKKVLMLATTAAMIEQFNKNNIELLNEMGYIVDVAGNFREGNPISEERLEQFRTWIQERGGTYYDITAVRKPTAWKKNVGAYRQVVKLLYENQYAFVHVHTPIGSIIGRLAAHKTRTKIIYTAHGFHFFKGAPLKNWLLYYPAEWLCSWWTDILITINQEDYQLARKHMHARRTEYVPGVGIDTKKFGTSGIDRRKKREELGIAEDAVVLISVGELNDNKNHEVMIKAIGFLNRKRNDTKLHYLICGQGDREQYLQKLIEEEKLSEQVKLLGFQTDVHELLLMSDIFAFPSKREGLSVALMEAMAAGLPVICSKIRGNVDLVEDGKGGYLIAGQDIEDYADVILLLSQKKDKAKDMGTWNRQAIKRFDVQEIKKSMKDKVYK